MSIVTYLTQDAIDMTATEQAFRAEVGAAGASVSFCGTMRPTTKQGEALDRLVLEWHPRMTAQSLQTIAEAGAEAFKVDHVHVIHRCGPILAGEAIVFVGVHSPHRREAFKAADYIMDRLKTDAIFWKREEGAFGRRWIEPTVRDITDRQRWSETNGQD